MSRAELEDYMTARWASPATGRASSADWLRKAARTPLTADDKPPRRPARAVLAGERCIERHRRPSSASWSHQARRHGRSTSSACDDGEMRGGGRHALQARHSPPASPPQVGCQHGLLASAPPPSAGKVREPAPVRGDAGPALPPPPATSASASAASCSWASASRWTTTKTR